jgi:holo-[acyl-carrier protein] synthase
MIVGVGIDLVQMSRIEAAIARFGVRFSERILAPVERPREPLGQARLVRLVAKRFACKEALGKALGCGIRAPMTWHAAWISHTADGQPHWELSAALQALQLPRVLPPTALHQCRLHLSLADEVDYVVAHVIVERIP